ncbi:MAG TPA: hypothetical protein VFB38_27240, partial [Chthonomonadaceae bacterium]|nr:hypothetical protein [Chthonomonadaceae bacterium]
MNIFQAGSQVVSLYRVDKVIGDEVSTLYGYTTGSHTSNKVLKIGRYSRAVSLPYTFWKEGVEVAALGTLVLTTDTGEPKMSDNLTRYC